jgi:hypothetical protein
MSEERQRDLGINRMVTRKNHTCYGMGLGIMVLDDAYPGFPGDVRNASAWGYPIQYEIAEGVDNYTLVWEQDKTPCREPIVRAAKRLERMGCRAVAAECGYFAWFQKDVAAAVDVPVFMSSLLQVPFIQRVIGPSKQVGIVCAQKRFLTDTHLANVGIEIGSNYLVAGAQDEYGCPEFDKLWDHERRPAVPEAEYDKAEADMIRICREFVAKYPKIGAIMLECTGMQMFARAIQRELDLPVWSWGTLLDHAWSVVAHRDYYGHI